MSLTKCFITQNLALANYTNLDCKSVITFDCCCAGMNNSHSPAIMFLCLQVFILVFWKENLLLQQRYLYGNFIPRKWKGLVTMMVEKQDKKRGYCAPDGQDLRGVLAHSQSTSNIHEQDKTGNNILIISKEKQTQVINDSWIITGRFLHTSDR